MSEEATEDTPQEPSLLEQSSWAPQFLDFEQSITATKPDVLTMSNGMGLIYPNTMNAIIGESESFKSWVALYACMQLVHDHKNVLWVDLEASATTLIERARTIGMDPRLASLHVKYVQPSDGPNPPFTTDEGKRMVSPDWAAAQVAVTDVDLVVIDTLTAAMALYGLDGDKREEVDIFYRRMQALFEGKTVIFIDHLTKAGPKNRAAAGSERKRSFLDGSIISLTVNARGGRGRIGKVDVLISKDRHGQLDRFAEGKDRKVAEITVDGEEEGKLYFTIDPATMKRPDDDVRLGLMAYISEHEGCSVNALTKTSHELLTGSRSQRETALATLIRAGYVGVEHDEATRARRHFLLKPLVLEDEPDESDLEV